MNTPHRSLLRAEIVVETNGSLSDHMRVARYVADVTRNAAKAVKGGAVLTRVSNAETGESYGFAGHGEEMSEVSRENLDILFHPYEDENTSNTQTGSEQ